MNIRPDDDVQSTTRKKRVAAPSFAAFGGPRRGTWPRRRKSQRVDRREY